MLSNFTAPLLDGTFSGTDYGQLDVNDDEDWLQSISRLNEGVPLSLSFQYDIYYLQMVQHILMILILQIYDAEWKSM